MDDVTPFTDEELAEMQEHPLLFGAMELRLIADLRASQAREEVWAQANQELQAEVERLRALNRHVWERASEADAEVERLQADIERLQTENTRLQAENNQLEKWIPSGW